MNGSEFSYIKTSFENLGLREFSSDFNEFDETLSLVINKVVSDSTMRGQGQ